MILNIKYLIDIRNINNSLRTKCLYVFAEAVASNQSTYRWLLLWFRIKIDWSSSHRLVVWPFFNLTPAILKTSQSEWKNGWWNKRHKVIRSKQQAVQLLKCFVLDLLCFSFHKMVFFFMSFHFDHNSFMNRDCSFIP